MLRIAVPNKGSLSEPATDMLREAGYRQRRDSRELVLADPENDVEFFFLRPRDVAVYVGSGTVDVGITGRDLLLDSGAQADEHLALGFAGSTFRFAAPAGTASSLEDIAGKRIATSYNVLVASYLAEKGVEPAGIVHLDGAVESSVKLGVADLIADVVETGTTLRAAGLEVFGEPILRSEAVLIKRRGVDASGVDTLTRRLQGDKADQVLAKLSPVDFTALEPGELRRTRAAQVAAAMWAQDGGFTLVCFRSVAGYVMGLLTHSAQPGSELA